MAPGPNTTPRELNPFRVLDDIAPCQHHRASHGANRVGGGSSRRPPTPPGIRLSYQGDFYYVFEFILWCREYKPTLANHLRFMLWETATLLDMFHHPWLYMTTFQLFPLLTPKLRRNLYVVYFLPHCLSR